MGEWPMKVYLFAFLVFLGGAIFLLSFIADRQTKLNEDRLSIMKKPKSLSEIDFNLQFVTERSPYMRDER
jgi:hypothetical protein